MDNGVQRKKAKRFEAEFDNQWKEMERGGDETNSSYVIMVGIVTYAVLGLFAVYIYMLWTDTETENILLKKEKSGLVNQVSMLTEENNQLKILRPAQNNPMSANANQACKELRADAWAKISINNKDCVYQFVRGLSYNVCKER